MEAKLHLQGKNVPHLIQQLCVHVSCQWLSDKDLSSHLVNAKEFQSGPITVIVQGEAIGDFRIRRLQQNTVINSEWATLLSLSFNVLLCWLGTNYFMYVTISGSQPNRSLLSRK